MAAAAGPCDDRAHVMQGMGAYVYPPWVPLPPLAPAALPPCDANQPLCQIKRRNNKLHPVPPWTAIARGRPNYPTTRHRTVCDVCDAHGRDIMDFDRLKPVPPPVPGVPVLPFNFFFQRGLDNIFRDNGAHHAAAVALGASQNDMQLGAHYMGKLCTLCENTEIERYWQRRFGGARRQTAARAANTCKCEAFLRKRLCYQDRLNYIIDIEGKSGRNAAWGANWLMWLYYDAAAGRARWAQPGPARIALAIARHANQNFQANACRCGRPITTAGIGYTANNVPTPAAMCTACDGILIDVTHPRVVNWGNWGQGQRPPTLPPGEQGNLKLGRRC